MVKPDTLSLKLSSLQQQPQIPGELWYKTNYSSYQANRLCASQLLLKPNWNKISNECVKIHLNSFGCKHAEAKTCLQPVPGVMRFIRLAPDLKSPQAAKTNRAISKWFLWNTFCIRSKAATAASCQKISPKLLAPKSFFFERKKSPPTSFFYFSSNVFDHKKLMKSETNWLWAVVVAQW